MSSTEDLVSKASAVAKNCQVDEIDSKFNDFNEIFCIFSLCFFEF